MGDSRIGLDTDTGCAVVVIVILSVLAGFALLTVPWMTVDSCMRTCGEGNIVKVSVTACTCVLENTDGD